MQDVDALDGDTVHLGGELQHRGVGVDPLIDVVKAGAGEHVFRGAQIRRRCGTSALGREDRG